MKPIYYVGLGVLGVFAVSLMWPKPKLTIHFQPMPPSPPPLKGGQPPPGAGPPPPGFTATFSMPSHSGGPPGSADITLRGALPSGKTINFGWPAPPVWMSDDGKIAVFKRSDAPDPFHTMDSIPFPPGQDLFLALSA